MSVGIETVANSTVAIPDSGPHLSLCSGATSGSGLRDHSQLCWGTICSATTELRPVLCKAHLILTLSQF